MSRRDNFVDNYRNGKAFWVREEVEDYIASLIADR